MARRQRFHICVGTEPTQDRIECSSRLIVWHDIVERLRRSGDSLRANLGIGQGASVLEIVKAVESLTGAAVRYRFAARRSGDPATLVADAALARRELDWEPRYRDVREIVRTAIGGYQRSHRGATV